MSISDIIPGFSGGIALTITGKLQDVWGTLDKIKNPKNKGDRLAGIVFYGIFLTGSLAGTFGFSQVIYLLIENIPTYTFWFFIGLTICSLMFYWKFSKMKIPQKKTFKPSRLMAFITGMSLIIAICTTTFVLRGEQTIEMLKNASGEVNNMTIYILIYVAGFLASAAMVTPGMSGALVILAFGVYGNIYGGLYKNPGDHWLVLSLYFLCTIGGTVTSIFTLDKLYKKFTGFMNYVFLGTIVGSLIGMCWIFNSILIPSETLGPLYIVLSVLTAFTFAFLILMGYNYREKKEAQKLENQTQV